MSQWCVTALFFKDDDTIDIYCRLALSNITGPQVNYLDQGLWAISVEVPVPMEVKCKDHSYVKTLETPVHPHQPATSMQHFLFCNLAPTLLQTIFLRLPRHIEVCKPPYSQIYTI